MYNTDCYTGAEANGNIQHLFIYMDFESDSMGTWCFPLENNTATIWKLLNLVQYVKYNAGKE